VPSPAQYPPFPYCHPEEAESLAARRTPNEGSMHSRREPRCPGSRCLCQTWDEKNYPSAPIKPRYRIFRSRNPLFQPRSAMTSTEANESHEPSRGLLAGGHPLPSLRPRKNRNCITRNAVMDEHPRPVSPKPEEAKAGHPTPFCVVDGAKMDQPAYPIISLEDQTCT